MRDEGFLDREGGCCEADKREDKYPTFYVDSWNLMTDGM